VHTYAWGLNRVVIFVGKAVFSSPGGTESTPRGTVNLGRGLPSPQPPFAGAAPHIARAHAYPAPALRRLTLTMLSSCCLMPFQTSLPVGANLGVHRPCPKPSLAVTAPGQRTAPRSLSSSTMASTDCHAALGIKHLPLAGYPLLLCVSNSTYRNRIQDPVLLLAT